MGSDIFETASVSGVSFPTEIYLIDWMMRSFASDYKWADANILPGLCGLFSRYIGVLELYHCKKLYIGVSGHELWSTDYDVLPKSFFRGITEIHAPKLCVYYNETDAFSGNAFLRELNLPSLFECYGTFRCCSALVSVQLPALRIAPTNMFNGCESLESARLDSLDVVQHYMFYGCRSLKTVYIPVANVLYGNCFEGCGFEEVDFDSVTIVNNNAFTLCSSLRRVRMRNVTSLDVHVFHNCYSLEYLDLQSLRTFVEERQRRDGVLVGHGSFTDFPMKSLKILCLPKKMKSELKRYFVTAIRNGCKVMWI